MPDELWTEVHGIVQETGIKAIHKKRKCKKAKLLSEETLKIAVKRKEVKSKGEKERYKHLNSEFQRIARRDKKGFLSDQCKEIEENNRMERLEISAEVQTRMIQGIRRGDGFGEFTGYNASAIAAKSLQSCLTLCDPIDGSPSGSAVPGILQARTLEWVAISFSNRIQ